MSVRSGLLVAALLAGCAPATDRVVAQPTDINLADAMRDVVLAFREAQQVSQATGAPIGIYPCTVTVTFNITAGTGSNRSIVLDAQVTPPVRVVQGSLGLRATSDEAQTASRGNQIVVLLTSAACNPPNTLGTLRPHLSGRPRPVPPGVLQVPRPRE